MMHLKSESERKKCYVPHAFLADPLAHFEFAPKPDYTNISLIKEALILSFID